MTISINVSVKGNYKVPVTIKPQVGEETTTILSGKGYDGPHVMNIPYYHGGENGVTVIVGKEEIDNA